MTMLLPGYAGTVWNSARAAISYASSNLSTTNQQQSKVIAKAVAATLKNGVTALGVDMAYKALQQVYANLAEIVPLALGVDGNTEAFLQNRVSALQAATLSLKTLYVTPSVSPTQALAGGNPSIADPMFLEWLQSFAFEVTPSGLAASNLGTQAQAAATAWTTIAAALAQQSLSYSGAAFNTVQLMGRAAQVTADAVINSTPSSLVSVSQLWNQFVASPSILRSAMAIANDPTDQVAQDTAVIRYVMLNTLQQFDSLILSLREVVSSQVKLGTVKVGDSPMSFAARELNDYTTWQSIVQLNGLLPPYFSTVKGPNVAVPGQQLLLPSPNGSTTISPQTAPIASYINNYLGVDRFLGPLNQPMLPWTGDYQLISGYQNLSFSLGRRLQTVIGSFIYHSQFGSRIPPEIGKIASGNELALIKQYAISCLKSDPRVNKVLSCTCVAGANYSVYLTAVVLPNGLGQEEVTVNEVIGPA